MNLPKNCWYHRRFVCFLSMLLSVLLSTKATAQITVETLLKTAVAQVGPEHADVSKAIETFRAGNFLETRELLKSAKAADPRIPPAGVMLSQLLYTINQPGLARGELERVAKDEPNEPQTYVMFGELAFQQRRFSDAELAFLRAVELTRNYSANPFRKNSMVKRSFSGLARVAEAREDWVTVAKYLAPILKADPTDVATTTRMANSVFKQAQAMTNKADKQKKEAEAYVLLQELWKKNDTVQRPEITMGRLYEAAGNRALAASLMKKASARDQQGLATQLSVARWAMEAGDLELAQTCGERAIAISPDSVDAKLVAGLVARYQQDYPRARKALEAAHLQSPSNLAAMLQLSVVLAEMGLERAALDYAEISRRVYSDLSKGSGREAAVTLAWVLYRQGRAPEAQQQLQRALTGGGVSSESSYFAARILYQQGNRKDAKTWLEAALRNDRVFPGRKDAEKLLSTLGSESASPSIP